MPSADSAQAGLQPAHPDSPERLTVELPAQTWHFPLAEPQRMLRPAGSPWAFPATLLAWGGLIPQSLHPPRDATGTTSPSNQDISNKHTPDPCRVTPLWACNAHHHIPSTRLSVHFRPTTQCHIPHDATVQELVYQEMGLQTTALQGPQISKVPTPQFP